VTLSPSDYDALQAYARKAGAVLLTHDAVGYRSFPVLFAEVCEGGRTHVQQTEFTVDSPDGTTQKGTHTYYDHITLQPGEGTRVLARGPGGNGVAPVAVVGSVGRGRVGCTGLALGLGPDNTDAELSPTEARLLRLMLDALSAR
jgi:hypothetical protein